MNPTLITDLLTYALPSGFLAGTVTWLVSRRKRRNDMLADMQRSIDLLCEKYNDVLQENVTLRREKADWLVAQQELLRKIDKLTREVEGLRKNFNRKTQKKTDETSPTKKTARAAAAAAPDGSRMCDDPHHDADLGHTDPNTFGTKRRKIATRQPRTTTTATATGVRLDITNPADCDRIPADGPDPAGDPLKDLDHLPPGAAYTARSGRAAIRAEKQDDSLIVTGISDRAERRTWLLTNQTFRRQRQSDSLASHTGLRNLSSFARDTTLLRETHASTTRKKSSGNLFRTLFTGIALGILLTVVFRKTGVWAAIRRFLKNLLP